MATVDSNAAPANGQTGQKPMLARQRAKDDPARDNGRVPIKKGMFPLGYKEGFSQWWANVTPAAAEHKVLSYIPYLEAPPTHTQTGTAPDADSDSTSLHTSHAKKADAVKTSDPFGRRIWRSILVPLSGKNRALNEYSVERSTEPVEENLVMLHGYGAGLGFFYKNYEGLSRVPGWKIWSLDLLGMGRSSRPPFRIVAKERPEKVTEAEDFFIDALEEWRQKRKIERFTLLGHSLGGYLATAYALKYPGHLNKVVLASPVGIPEDPYAVNASMPDSDQSGLANEFSQDQNETTELHGASQTNGGDKNNFLNKGPKSSTTTDSATPPPRKPIPKWLTYAWDANISPFSLVRWSGPLGPRFVSGWTTRRFSQLGTEEAEALHTYSYSLFKQRGSGEYALAYILAPGAFARSPLIRRIQGVGRQLYTPSTPTTSSPSAPARAPEPATPAPASARQVRENGVPVVLMYGENDWMDIEGGYAAERKIRDETKRIRDEKRARGESTEGDHGEAKVLVIKGAGHHVYLDGWEEFNEVMREEMEDVTRRERGDRERSKRARA